MQIVLEHITFNQLRELRNQLIQHCDAVAVNHSQVAHEVNAPAYQVGYREPSVTLFVGTDILDAPIRINFSLVH